MNNNMDYNYYHQLIRDLAEYIQDEMQDSAYYQELAKLAPTDRARTLILEFSQDEYTHARNFQEAYRMLTGNYYAPMPLNPVVILDYEEALKTRVIAETRDYKKYGEKYLRAPNKYLQDLFFMTRTDEAIHAMRIPVLFEEEND
jgi:rubrerythrin